MRFFTIAIAAALLMLASVGCIDSIRGGAILTHMPEQVYARYHTIDLRFVLHNSIVMDGQVTLTEIPSGSTQTEQIRWGFARVNVPIVCDSLYAQVSVGMLNIHPITVPNSDGTHTLFLEEEVEKERQP